MRQIVRVVLAVRCWLSRHHSPDTLAETLYGIKREDGRYILFERKTCTRCDKLYDVNV